MLQLDLTDGSSGIGVDREKNLSQDISVLLSGMTVEDRRAPGCEKKFVQTANDYEHKKFLATKAVKNKPMGEVRTPNAVWSGKFAAVDITRQSAVSLVPPRTGILQLHAGSGHPGEDGGRAR